MRRPATFRSCLFSTSVISGSPLRNLPVLFYPHPRGRFRIGLPGFLPVSPFAENSGRRIRSITRGCNKFWHLSVDEHVCWSRVVSMFRHFYCIFHDENSHDFCMFGGMQAPSCSAITRRELIGHSTLPCIRNGLLLLAEWRIMWVYGGLWIRYIIGPQWTDKFSLCFRGFPRKQRLSKSSGRRCNFRFEI